jgi:hypothetical protein
VTGGGAVLVAAVAGSALWQRHRADRKEQWWTRTQWALELLLSGEEEATVLGLNVVRQQVRAKVADREDAAFIVEVLTPKVDSYQGEEHTEDEARSEHGSQEDRREH